MKRWSSQRLFLQSQIWKVLQEILKSPLPVWLTGRLSLAGNSPKFNSSSASSSTQSFDESTSCARSPESERSAQSRPRWFLISQKQPPDSSPRNAGQCGRSNSVSYCCTFWESQIFKEYPQILQTIQNIHWFQSFSHQRGSCRASSVSSHQLWQRVSFPLLFI